MREGAHAPPRPPARAHAPSTTPCFGRWWRDGGADASSRILRRSLASRLPPQSLTLHTVLPRARHRFSPHPSAPSDHPLRRSVGTPDFIYRPLTCETAVDVIFIRHYYAGVMSWTCFRRDCSVSVTWHRRRRLYKKFMCVQCTPDGIDGLPSPSRLLLVLCFNYLSVLGNKRARCLYFHRKSPTPLVLYCSMNLRPMMLRSWFEWTILCLTNV